MWRLTFLKNSEVFIGLLLFFIFTSVLSVGCGRQKNGYYEGYLEVNKEFTHSPQKTGLKGFKGSKWVGVEIQRLDWKGTIRIFDPKTDENVMESILLDESFSVTHNPKDVMKIDVSMPSLRTEFRLSHKSDCFEGNSKNSLYYATACLNQNEVINIDISENSKTIFHLSAAPFSKPKLGRKREGPLTLKQAINIALHTSPASAIELEHKFQAKMLALSAAFNLTTRLNLPTAINIGFAPISPLSYIQAIGTLAPFLSMTSWLNAFQASLRSKVADISYRIAQADLATQVEGLVYVYKRDVTLNHAYQKFLLRAESLLEKVLLMEKQGQIDGVEYIKKNTYKVILELISNIKDLQISSSLPADKSAIAQALGIHDIELIRNIQIVHEELPIELAFDNNGKPIKLNKNKIAAEAEQKSLEHMERLQAKYAVEEAKQAQKGRFFKLLDPVGDLNSGFGLGLIWEGKLDRSNIRAARQNQMMIHDQIRRGAFDIVETYNDALDGYKEALNNFHINQEVLDELLNPIENFEVSHQASEYKFDLKDRFEDTILAYTKMISYHSGFRIARSILNRMLLKGYYSEVDKIIANIENSSELPLELSSLDPPADCEDDKILDNVFIDGEEDQYSIYSFAADSPKKAFEK